MIGETGIDCTFPTKKVKFKRSSGRSGFFIIQVIVKDLKGENVKTLDFRNNPIIIDQIGPKRQTDRTCLIFPYRDRKISCFPNERDAE